MGSQLCLILIFNKNPQIIVISCRIDLIIKRRLDTSNIKTLIVDEADEMLSQGFKDLMYLILQKCQKN